MKIFTGNQIREVEHEPIDSVALMERAAKAIAGWVGDNVPPDKRLLLLTETGNNDGDALAVARILYHAGYDYAVIQPFLPEELSPECAYYRERLPTRVTVSDRIPDFAGKVSSGSYTRMPPSWRSLVI